MPKPNDIDELISSLLEAYDWVKTDPKRAGQVKEMTNAAGKAIAAMKSKMMYAVLRGEEPEIPFMGKTSGRPLKPEAKLITG